MFTVMERRHLLLWLLIGGLAIGGGWAAYELRRPAPEPRIAEVEIDDAQAPTDAAPVAPAPAPVVGPAPAAQMDPPAEAQAPPPPDPVPEVAASVRAEASAPPATPESARGADATAPDGPAALVQPEPAPRELPADETASAATVTPQPEPAAPPIADLEPEPVEPAGGPAVRSPPADPSGAVGQGEPARAAPPPIAAHGEPGQAAESEAPPMVRGADPDPATVELAPDLALAPPATTPAPAPTAGPPAPDPADSAQAEAAEQPVMPEPAAGPADDRAVESPAPPTAAPSRAESSPPASATGGDASSSARGEAENAEAAPRESLLVDTIRRALSAMLGSQPDSEAAPPESGPEPAAPAVAPPAPSESPTTEVARSEAARTAPRAPAGTPPQPRDVQAPDEAAPAPTFDIVRVERDGRAVIAGRAEPGAEIEIRAGDRVIDRVEASRRGEWVATPTTPLPAGDHELTLAARLDGEAAVESKQVVVVAVPEPPPPQPVEVAGRGAPESPVAVLLPRQGRGLGRILQAPGKISSTGQLALIMVDYDQTGQIQLSGHAPAGAPVRVYVDNRPAAEATGDADGNWAAQLDRSLAPGDYTLRLDQLDREGRPVARLETPFTRVSQPPIEGQVQVDYVVVQPGNSLWRIARRLFGEGIKYSHIYEANQSQIRDPDMIYPGQVFEVPANSGAAG